MPPRPHYPTFVYSGGQWPLPLGGYPQFPPHAYPVGYPQYPTYLGAPAYGVTPSPRRRRRRSLTPEEVKPHPLLGGQYRATVSWDVSRNLSAAKYYTSRGMLEKVPEALFQEPATEPPVSRMRIVSDFSWEINVVVPRNEVVTVGHIFNSIYGVLQETLEKEDWDRETPNVKRAMHRARCARLSKSEALFKVDSHLKKIDAFGEKTHFWGLSPVGPPEEPVEWLLKLGSQPKQGRR